MDHGDHDASPARCNMNMLFTWSTRDLCIIFRSWHITGPITLTLSLFAIVALVAAFEALRATTARTASSNIKRGAPRTGGKERAICGADVLCVYDYAAVHDIQWTGDDCGGRWGLYRTLGFCGRDDVDEGDRLSLGKGRSRRRKAGGRSRR
ncbi:hypothetical protein V498_04151 [Pseudogymnoascus sp. VKM F-4517 (FW-2822)]|nr:hypothetical protein V498_04151 [Pseudogymnoascus sp. VKM F-4517 (FW-2822)]